MCEVIILFLFSRSSRSAKRKRNGKETLKFLKMKIDCWELWRYNLLAENKSVFIVNAKYENRFVCTTWRNFLNYWKQYYQEILLTIVMVLLWFFSCFVITVKLNECNQIKNSVINDNKITCVFQSSSLLNDYSQINYKLIYRMKY